MRWRTVFLITVFFLAGFGAGFFADQLLQSGTPEPAAEEFPVPGAEPSAGDSPAPASDDSVCIASGLVLERSELLRREDGTVIEGTITNAGGRNISAANVDFALFDRNNSSLGTASVYSDTFPANGTWDFTAVVMDPEVVSYNLTGLCGY